MKKRFFTLSATLCLVVLSLTGCVTEEKRQQIAFGERPRESYSPVDGSSLVLELVGDQEFPAGEPATLTFSLRNNGSEKVEIPEWYACETDNIILYCQIWGVGETEPVEERWIPMAHVLHYPDTRYPLTLMPGQLVTVSRDLDFVGSMVVASGTERRYFVKAETNLDSLKVESPVAGIRITAGMPPERTTDATDSETSGDEE